ncbi:hypothetical protein [Streptomyces sp. LaPpAH-108]|uniref:hypothetical protein n=1 Tax=Streptomyces sp. LaPpAH-108 TaxID=1155714 RepID=UPI00037D02FB|nr:hypothetical protein [Streptomyces sp. LaPpAH-108]
MGSLGDLAGQAVGALMGTLTGGAITVHVARWQTAAAGESARRQWARQRSAEAAQRLLERFADLYAWLPSLPDLALEEPRFSPVARERCSAALGSVRRGMQTDLLSIGDARVRARYRTLVRLCHDVGWRSIGQDDRETRVRDVRGYLRYVQFTLEAVIDGRSLPDDCPAPVLERGDGVPWLPPVVPWYWRDPADGS